MIKREIYNVHRRKRLTKGQLLLTLSATTLGLVLTGCGADKDKITTEEIEYDSVHTEETENNNEEYYKLDRLADEYAPFVVKVKENGNKYNISIMVEDTNYLDFELVYDASSHIFTCEDEIVLDKVELVDGSEVVSFSEVEDGKSEDFVKSDDLDTKTEKMNYGKRFKVEDGKNDDELKITYLDVETEVADKEDKKATTEETTTETMVDNSDEEEPSDDGGEDEGGSQPKPEPTPQPAPNPTPTPTPEPTPEPTPAPQPTPQPQPAPQPTPQPQPAPQPTPQPQPAPQPEPTPEPAPEPTTEAPATTECQHNYVAVMGERSVHDHDECVCLYCGHSELTVSAINSHCRGCGGVYTHEELADADPFVYNALIGTVKGSSYTIKSIYRTEQYVIHYMCSHCGSIQGE